VQDATRALEDPQHDRGDDGNGQKVPGVRTKANREYLAGKAVELLRADWVSPGKFLVLVEGELAAVEEALVSEAVALSHGNKSAAARLLGVHRKALGRRVDEMDKNGQR